MGDRGRIIMETRLGTPQHRWIAQSIASHANSIDDKIAVRDGATELCYKELIDRATVLSRAIEGLAGPDLPIGIFLPNAASYLVALLALSLVGRTSVPLDTAHPDEHNRRIVDHAGLGAAIVDPGTAPLMRRIAPTLRLIDASSLATDVAPAPASHAAPSPHHIFMISYTSGSTDLPKGVCITERCMNFRFEYSARESSLGPDDRIPLLQSLSGAGSVRFAFDALLHGAQVGIFDLKRLGLTATRDLLRAFRPTVYLLVPSTFRILFGPNDTETKSLARDVRWVRLGNERVLHSDVQLYRNRFATTCRLVVSVGTTETSTYVAWALDHAKAVEQPLVPVGRRLDGVDLELTRDDGATAMPGEIGEICVTSPTVAAGYWRDEVQTSARFIPSPKNPASTRYQTGDYGRFLPNGLLEFIGRRDRQVKVRANTINLGEVEAILGGHPDLAEVGIVARQDATETVLAAYCTPAVGRVLSEERLRNWCRVNLSAPMRPTHFFMVSALPRLPTGKVDLAALAVLDARHSEAEAPAATSEIGETSPLFNIVRKAWTSVLPAQSFTADASFDAAGGNSLKGLDLVLRLEILLGRPIAIGALDLETRPSELIRRLTHGILSDRAAVDARPVIAFFPHLWSVDVEASDFWRQLSRHFTLIAIDPRPGGDAMAGDFDADRYFASAIDVIRRAGPKRLWLVGYCFGGKLAAETARRLLASGVAVEALIVLDGAVGTWSRRFAKVKKDPNRTFRQRLRSGLTLHGGAARFLFNIVLARIAPLVVRSRSVAARHMLAFGLRFASPATQSFVARVLIVLTRRSAFWDLPGGVVPATLRLFITDDPSHDPAQPDLGWGRWCESVQRVTVGGTHRTMLLPPVRDRIVAEFTRLEIELRNHVPSSAVRKEGFMTMDLAVAN
jgi:acyl-CoA synthetase (AMP-forming)/AMP-acid ligase II/thioesterase domain-containing protein